MKFTPLRVTIIYLVFALFWIFSTDSILLFFLQDPELITQWQIAKGFFYVFVTAGGLYLMMKSYEIYIQKEAAKIKEMDRSLNLALSSAQMATWQYFPDEDRYITSPNHNSLFGIDENEDINLDLILSKVDDDFLEKFTAKAEKTLKTGEDFNIEYKVKTSVNESRWLWSKGSVIKENGREKCVSGVTINITERKRLESKLKVEQEKFEKLYHKIPVLITMYDPSINVSVVNNEFEKVLGWSDEDAKKVNLMEVCYPDPEYRKEVADFMSQPDRGWKELDVLAKNGEVRKQLWTNITLSDDTIVGIGHDITERKKLEEQIKSEREELALIFDNMPVFVNIHDEKGEGIAGVNKFFEERMGYTSEEVESKDILKLIISEEEYESAKEHILKSDGTWKNFELITKSGERVLSTWSNIRLSDHKSIGIGLDVTEQKQRESELRESEQLLKLTQRMASLGTYILNPETFEVNSSEILKEIFGLEDGVELSTEILLEMMHPDDREVPKSYLKALKNGEQFEGNFRIIRKVDGKERWIKEKTVLEKDESGKVTQVIGIMQDITDLKQIQKSLEYEQRRFEYAALVVSDAIWDAIPYNNTIWWSEGFKTNFGYDIPPKEMGYQVWYDNVHPDDRDRVVNTLEEKERGTDTYWKSEYRFRRADGSYAIVIDRAFILRDEHGELIRIIGAMNDITKEKTEEEKLKRSEEQYRLLFEQSPMPMWIFDPETYRFESANKAATETYGYSLEEFKQMTVFDLYRKEDQEAIRAETEKNLKQERSGFDLWTHLTKSGEEIYVEISGSYIYSGGERKRLIIANDVTLQKKAEEKSYRAMVEGEERERHRIANELHDGLGQYLSAANMNLTSVFEDLPELDKKLSEPFEHGLQMLDYAISETRSISQNLLPKSIQDYGLELALKALINDLKSTHDINLHLYQSYPVEKLPQSMQVNIYRIIQESLHNAIRHADASEVNVQIILSGEELICTIEDDGKGFDPSLDEGTGLGIQSMKTRVAAMAGNFDIDSKINSGTLITVMIPVKDQKDGKY